MKKFISMALLLVGLACFSTGPALASGGGGGGHGKPKESTKAEPTPFGTKKVSESTANFLPFLPSAATIFSGYQPAGLMHFEYGLEIEDPRIRAHAAKLAPRLRDAYGRVLSQYAGSLYTPGEVPDMNYLATRMQGVTDRIIGKGKAHFLVSTLMVREN